MVRHSWKISLEQQKQTKKIKKYYVEYNDKYFTIFFPTDARLCWTIATYCNITQSLWLRTATLRIVQKIAVIPTLTDRNILFIYVYLKQIIFNAYLKWKTFTVIAWRDAAFLG